MPDPTSRIMAREKLPMTGIDAYHSKFVGKFQNRSETICILPQTALITSNNACINLNLRYKFYSPRLIIQYWHDLTSINFKKLLMHAEDGAKLQKDGLTPSLKMS